MRLYLFIVLSIFIVIVPAHAKSPLSDAEKEGIKERGEISAIAEWCGLDWLGRSFKPFMKRLRQKGFPEKKMTFVGVYHGRYMARKIMDLEEGSRTCAQSDIDKISEHLSKKKSDK